VKKILRFIGKLGKGGATIAGAVLGVSGVSLGGTDVLDCFQKITTAPADTLTALGLALLLFGIGRKAGAVATKP
jgi:hypothetical protein